MGSKGAHEGNQALSCKNKLLQFTFSKRNLEMFIVLVRKGNRCRH